MHVFTSLVLPLQSIVASASTEQAPKKPKSEIVRYNREFLLKFMDVSSIVCSLECPKAGRRAGC